MKIGAGIVLYNPEIERLKENILAIEGQVDFLFLIDNGSSNISAIMECCVNDKIILVKNESNKGIAFALNQIFVEAEKLQLEWCLTLDQDSVCPPNMIHDYRSYIDLPQLGILCPCIKDRNTMLAKQDKDNKREPLEQTKRCITSGSFVNVKAWRDINGFCDPLFIDYVDFDFAIRLQECEHNYSIYRVNTVELLHQLGDIKEVKLFGKVYVTTNHIPIRRYYNVRNRIYCARKYPQYTSRKMTMNFIMRTFLLILLYEKDKRKKIKAMLCGIIDGLRFCL